MAVIEERKNKAGHSYKVTWYSKGVRQKPITLKSRKEAEEWKRLIELHKGDQDAAAGALAKVRHTGPTMTDIFEHWIERRNVTPYTRQNYESYWRNHIGPAMGHYPVTAVTTDDIRALVKTMADKGLAPKTIRNNVGILSPVLSHAVKYSWLESSPYDDELLPANRMQTAERDKFLSRDEIELILGGFTDPTPYRVMLATGMRPGELCALDVSDAYLHDRQPSIRVNKAVKQDRVHGDYIGEPKSEKSVRTIGIPPSVVALLEPLATGRPPSAPLFTQADGPGKNPKRVRLRRKRMYQTWQRQVGKLREAGKLSKNPNLYSLRHTHASMMIGAGMQMWPLSRHLGHSSVTTTETHYLHLMPEAVYQVASYAETFTGQAPELES